jgi:EAL domain-containing protein (putative c-di-GMP-specific phosphodiesterase class I)/GGDEF domain-containing protein
VRPVVEPGEAHAAEDTRRLRTGFLRLKSALFDPVTGLYSYNLHLDQLEMQCAGRRLGVIALEFPSFAALEQTHGWEVGDRFLAGVASQLKGLRGRVYPESTLVSLEGIYGNAFTLFLKEGPRKPEVSVADLADACAGLSAHLLTSLAEAAWSPTPPPIDVSIGYSLVCPNPAARFERMVRQGIREARSMTLREADQLQRRREAELRAIMQEGRLTTHYQPIVDMDRGSIMGYEALTRGPENTVFEGPKALFGVSDQSRLSGALDVLCRQRALLNARGFDPEKKLFLNSLPETLGTPGLVDGNLKSILEEVALQPHNLVLEITERSAIEDFEAFGRELERLRRLGFLVAIDDVGTGYSSLQTISEVPADFLKIDISLVQNIHQSLIKQDLVHSLLQVASRTRARVIAEGIETAEEYRALRVCGVRYGQGFYFARPAPAFPVLARGGTGSA